MDKPVLLNRLISIDILRGYFLLVIIIDHFGRFPNFLEWVSGRGALWVTAAEGFFFVSGLMLGLTAVRKLNQRGFWPTAKKMWRRSALLYILSIATTLGFTYIAFQLGWAPKGGLIETQHWPTIISQTLSMSYAYGWADFLPRYALYMAVAPIAAYLLIRGYWWAVVWMSGLVWLAIGPTNFTYAWQILFFLGMVFGYYLPQTKAWASSWSQPKQTMMYRSSIALSAVLLVASVVVCLFPMMVYDYSRFTTPIITSFSTLAERDNLVNYLTSINTDLSGWLSHQFMGPGRIALFLLYFGTAFAVLQRHGQKVAHGLGWLLFPLGKNSLLTYITHACVLFALDIYVLRQPGFKWNFLHTILAIGLVWSMVVIVSNKHRLLPAVKQALVQLPAARQVLANPAASFKYQLSTSSSLFSHQAGSATKSVAVAVPLIAIFVLAAILTVRSLL